METSNTTVIEDTSIVERIENESVISQQVNYGEETEQKEERRVINRERDRRKSTIFSIINPETEMRNVRKSKPCLPIFCQKCTLIIFVISFIAILWLSMLPQFGYEIYKSVANNNSSDSARTPSLPERLLTNVNLSNESVECPQMYIFVSGDNSCKPRCGEWSGCGVAMYYIERFLFIALDLCGVMFGVFGLISWLISFREVKFKKHFALIICVFTAILSSLFFAALDIPGNKYLYCSNEEKQWDVVRSEGSIHIQIYSGSLFFMSTSFIIWLWLALLNIALVTYFPMSKRLNSNSYFWKMFLVEVVLGWGTPVLLFGVFIAIGGRSYLERPIQHPTRYYTDGRFLLGLPFHIVFRLIITTFFMIVYRIRIQTLNTQKYAHKKIETSVLEKRFIVIGVLYVVLLFIRSFYGAVIGFAYQWEELNRAYAACVTLESPILHYANISLSNSTSYAYDLLPEGLREQVPECYHPCVLPFGPIFFRSGWIIIFSITTLQPVLSLRNRLMAKKASKPFPSDSKQSTGKGNTIRSLRSV